MRRTVIVSGARTPFGRFGGGLKEVPAVDLGAAAMRGAMARAGIEGRQVEQVILGMVLQSGAGQIPSRQATLRAGIPPEVHSETLNKVCASGLRAVAWADTLIRAGDADIVVAGGMENMSRAPYLSTNVRWGPRLGTVNLEDAILHDGLHCPISNLHMGVYGSQVALDHGIGREAQDEWAYRSHQRAIQAIQTGKFAEEIVEVEVPGPKGSMSRIELDEGPRADTSIEKLARLKPVFEPEGTVTAGNAPGINDGAAALVLMSEEKALAMGKKPLAVIVGGGRASAEPRLLNCVPAWAAADALKRAGLDLGQIELIECNEAFAAVTLTSIKLGAWDEEIVNVNGGAVALGHPIGASGARILLTMVMEMGRRGATFGLATICSGMAQGEAMIVRAWDGN
ncbi:MAG: acetyl-CoA C-acetyltransferase [Firmicutes bacterium]|nr:acetyl-CoA C-acetyltransferase [Bacillota bacterium]